jgi:hypothetical protein
VYCSGNAPPVLTNCTIVGNSARWNGGGICCHFASSPTIANCIIWSNIGGSIFVNDLIGPEVTNSCIEGKEVWGGEGNINLDPRFCGWPAGGEVNVSTQVDLVAALSEYSLALSPNSPCIQRGMGAETGTYEDLGERSRFIRLDPGTYDIENLTLTHHVSIKGASEEQTILEGTVRGLRTGCVLSQVTVTTGSGIVIGLGEGCEET